jgi:hypothetical protein
MATTTNHQTSVVKGTARWGGVWFGGVGAWIKGKPTTNSHKTPNRACCWDCAVDIRSCCLHGCPSPLTTRPITSLNASQSPVRVGRVDTTTIGPNTKFQRSLPSGLRSYGTSRLSTVLQIYILALHRKGSRTAQLGQAVPPRYFTCKASALVLRPRSSIVARALPIVPLFQ